jgi:hypothetical protein
VNHIKCLEVLFVLISQKAVDMFDPPIMWDVSSVGFSVKVDHNIGPIGHNWLKYSYQMKKCLVLHSKRWKLL